MKNVNFCKYILIKNLEQIKTSSQLSITRASVFETQDITEESVGIQQTKYIDPSESTTTIAL